MENNNKKEIEKKIVELQTKYAEKRQELTPGLDPEERGSIIHELEMISRQIANWQALLS